MKAWIPAMTFALVATAAAYAQDTETTVKSRTTSSGGEAKEVTYTGCIQDGTPSKTFVLAGESKTRTSYAIISSGDMKLQQHVGRKVEVTGLLIPAGDIKTETTTRIERDDAKDTKIRERVETRNSMPQFRVTSIKDLGERCE
jgi:hypothetical protein